MAHFYGSLIGKGFKAITRTGTKWTGMIAHIRGWNVGVRVELRYEGGKDKIRIYETGGSNNIEDDRFITELVEGGDM